MIRLRPARRNDGPAILALERELADFERLAGPSPEEGARLLAWIFEERRLEAVVAEEDGAIVGVALYYFVPASFRARPVLYLEDIVISAAHRGRNVGEMLMRRLAGVALERNCLRMEWAVLPWNEGALRFYRRLGATPQTEWVRYQLEAEEIRRIASPAGGEP